MKKVYIVPITKEVKFSYTKFVCSVYAGSLDGIRPEQIPGTNGDTGGAENPDDQATKYRGFYGSYDSEW